MSDEELKPCPFCGGDAIVKVKSFDVFNAAAWIECKRCHARTDLVEASVNYTAVERAKGSWNKRVLKA